MIGLVAGESEGVLEFKTVGSWIQSRDSTHLLCVRSHHAFKIA
jgi:hypothetical protein